MALPELIPPVLHPAVVHFPIALLLVTGVLVLFQNRLSWVPQAFPWLMGMAALSSLVAMVTGFLQRPDALEAWEGTAKEQWIAIHLILGLVVTWTSVALAVIAWLKRQAWSVSVPVAAVTVVLVCAGLVIATGWYGGAIVWDALPDDDVGDQLSGEGGNPFENSGGAGTEEPDSGPGSDPGSDPGQSGSDPGGHDPAPPQDACPTYAPGASTPRQGPMDGFIGEDTGTAGDSGLPIWELTVHSGTTGGTHYYNDPSGNKLATITVPTCREIHLVHFNEGGANHDLDIGDWQSNDPFVIDTPDLKGGQTATGTFVVHDTAGSVSFYCSVGKHAQQGQRGTFTVAAP